MADGDAGAEMLVVGRVVDAHGLRGELKLRLHNEASDLFEHVSDLHLRLGSGAPEPVRVTGARWTPKAWIVRLDGLNDRTSAEARRGSDLLVDPARLPELDDDEVYHYQLEGLAAFDTQQRPLGRVDRLFNSGAHDVLVLKDGDREQMVPFVDEMVVEIDLDAGTLTLDPPEGLLDV